MEINGKGLRYNQRKASFRSIPPEFLAALAVHCTLGTQKYSDTATGQPNWSLGMKYSILIDCVWRHLLRWIAGEQYDEEFGTHHLIACAWNLMVLFYFDMHEEYQSMDDRQFAATLDMTVRELKTNE